MKREKLCNCGSSTGKHEPQCPLDEIGVDFTDMLKIFGKLEKDCKISGRSRNPERIPKILKALEKIWNKNPDLRLEQLIHSACRGRGYYLEDDELIKTLREFYKNKSRG